MTHFTFYHTKRPSINFSLLTTGTCQGGFLCNTGECYPMTYRCDLMNDCPGGEDEEFCVSDRCKGFLCNTGECLVSYYRCDTFEKCPGGEDEKNCDHCRDGFLCNDKQCISYSLRCNGDVDCPDGEDEEECKTCKEGFLCNTGHCIPSYDRCDEIAHCPNGEDEENCNSCVNRFKCKTGQCIVFSNWCNNVTDCPGGEDEENCDQCPEGSFQCNTEDCIPGGWRCNGAKDCPNGDDEDGCSEDYYAGCPRGYFQCKDGLCIMDWYHCDGVVDCLYEESECDECRPGAFKCRSRQCIEGHRVCDGVSNCPEGEDEMNCSNVRENSTCPPGYMKCEGYCVAGRSICMFDLSCDMDTNVFCDSLVTADEAHQVRLRCSDYYRELVTLLGYLTPVSATFDDDYCLSLDENEFWSPLCQTGVVCDRFGCYDTELNRYSESYASRGPVKMSLLCKGTTLYYEDVSLYSERLEGVLTSKSLKLLLKQETEKSDLDDLQQMFRPSHQDQQEFAVAPEELVYSCSFDNQPCSHSDFYTWTSDRYGTCYTFNGFLHVNDTKARTVVHVGPKNGLQLTLNVPVGLPLLSPEKGMRVVIHSPHILPVPEEEGFNLGPGSSSVSVRRSENQRLGKPHGECRKEYEAELPFEYSPLLCDQLCVEGQLRQRCGCFIGLSPVYEALNYKPEERCEGKLPTQKLCIDRVTRDVIEEKIQCDCPQACREMKYQTQVASSKIDDVYYRILSQTRKEVPSMCSNDTELLRLLVYLGSMYYDVIEETPAYTWDTLLSNIGGSLGLFIGVSLVSILEVLEFLWDVCCISLRRCRKPGKLNVIHRD
ncbi:low-density lipoprotein receptor-related protein-like [Penaeus japonicus]|uniref:low-density lipoprotein receptor-related protein-like n=1 Tax=Penaeus japonicus TaxID=27405 RepID=UPI001C715E18|nr:low-density lipoprotein receptor-related protein-like [Penaeus japonicus]